MYEVAHVGLVVKDAERSSVFYREVLGCRPAGRHEDERVKLLFLEAGGQTIELVEYKGVAYEPRRAGTVDHLAFKVTDLEAAMDRLRAHGVTLLFDEPRMVMDGTKRIMFFAGPDGERLEFVQEVAK